MTTYITVAIPYVNAAPHIGYAYELIEADLAARARRELGESVRFLGGTDEYSLKNALAAANAGESTRSFVDRHADQFEGLADPLQITFDDFIRTSRDPRHRPAVERLWRACRDAGDLYQREYSGSYCVGCEQFYDAVEAPSDLCPEHGAPLELVSETNWFFRLSRYGDRIIDAIESGELHLTPDAFRTEILAFLRGGVDDISVSRSVERARGWGVPVPDDPNQVIYVWFDALTNYVSALGFGTHASEYDRWWRQADERIHVVGKGITRFHAVYWPAFLLSAGEPLPTQIQVHPYLQVDGAKISKSAGAAHSPTDLVDSYGADALRWWIARDVSPVADTDFTERRLVDRANETLANGLGNAINRVMTLVAQSVGSQYRDRLPGTEPLAPVTGVRLSALQALADFDRRAASSTLEAALAAVNTALATDEPWKLAKDPAALDRLVELLASYAASLIEISHAFAPICPDLSRAALDAVDAIGEAPTGPVYRRLSPPLHASGLDDPLLGGPQGKVGASSVGE